MPTAVVCQSRSALIGRHGGMFRSLSVVDLAVAALTGLLRRTGLPADAVDDVILGTAIPTRRLRARTGCRPTQACR